MSSQDIEDELRKLKQEMKRLTMLYNMVCQESETAKENVHKLECHYKWRYYRNNIGNNTRDTYMLSQDASGLEDGNHSQETAFAMVEREKMKCKAAVELANTAQRIAELEAEKRKSAEMKFKVEAEEREKAIHALSQTEIRYRKYTMEEIQQATNFFAGTQKIGEGGYGPVFKAKLDHTPVAIKVLRPNMSQGEKQFQREVIFPISLI